MANDSYNLPTATASGIPIPFTLEELREGILNICLLQLRTTSLFSNDRSDKRIWGLIGRDDDGIEAGSIWVDTLLPEDYGMNYADIADANLPSALEQQYSYAFLGVDTQKCEPMHYDTMHTHVAAYLLDLETSKEAINWEFLDTGAIAKRLLHVCELANARNILEGGECFFPFMNNERDTGKVDGALTVRQMALLSGMEEMTIRTSISRVSGNQLKAFKDERRTLIRIDDANEWLIAKGKYLPITYKVPIGEALDLEKTKFSSVAHFDEAMHRRCETESMKGSATEGQKLKQTVLNLMQRETHATNLMNEVFVGELASLLNLPPGLLVLRAREAVFTEELSKTTSALKLACAKSKSSI
jgi:hypothetical protein